MTGSPETVAILGTGTMGCAVARAAASAGASVVLGSRRPDAAREAVARIHPAARGSTLADAIRSSDFVVLALRWQGVFPVLEDTAPLWAGKTLVDLTNPATPDGRRLLLGHTTSGAEEIARRVPGAFVVKALNHVYAEVLDAGPGFGEIRAAAFFCGDAPPARERVGAWLASLGFDPVDAGALENARLLEPLAQLAVELVEGRGLSAGGTAFALARRP